MLTLKASLEQSRENYERLNNEQGELQMALLKEQSSTSDVETEMQKMAYERDRALDDVRSLAVKVETLEQQLTVAANERDSTAQRLKEAVNSASHFRFEFLSKEREAKSNENKLGNCKLEIDSKNKQIEELKKAKEIVEDELKMLKKTLREKEEELYQFKNAQKEQVPMPQQVTITRLFIDVVAILIVILML